MAVDIPDHLVFVSNLLSGTVTVVDGTSNAVITTITLPGTGLPLPDGLAGFGQAEMYSDKGNS